MKVIVLPDWLSRRPNVFALVLVTTRKLLVGRVNSATTWPDDQVALPCRCWPPPACR